MLCALTVRTLKPGTFEQFREAFMGEQIQGGPPPGWVRFNMIRKADDPDEVICFGFFDGTVDDLRSNAAEQGYEDQMKRIEPYVTAVGADGLYEIVEDFSAASSASPR